MSELATLLPTRRPELVSWPLSNDSLYLVRNRRTGEAFHLGEGEPFLRARLDGRHTVEEICASFVERFDEPLSEEDLAEFLDLAHTRGFLQQDGAAFQLLPADAFEENSPPPQARAQTPFQRLG